MAYTKFETGKGSGIPATGGIYDERFDHVEDGLSTAADDIDALEAGTGVLQALSEAFVIGDFTDNTDATGYVDMATTIPAGSMILGWKAVTATGFTGDTTAVIQVGIAGDLDRFSADTSGSVLAAGTVGSLAIAADALKGLSAVVTPRITVTGASDFGLIAAGATTVSVYYLPMG